MRRILFALPFLAACTGENVDEAFLSQHGAVLGRVKCVVDNDAARYQALMFLDGESQALNRYDCKPTPQTYEVGLSQALTGCSGFNKHLFD